MNAGRWLLLVGVGMLCLSVAAGEKKKRVRQYKKYPRDLVTQVARGDVDKALAGWKKFLEKTPDDLETHYGMAMCFTQKKDIGAAMKHVKTAVEKGLPVQRFLAGPRELFKPLVESDEFKTYIKGKDLELLHGPTLGSVTDGRARIWVRTLNEVPIVVHVSTKEDLSKPLEGKASTAEERDYTAVVEITGLSADTQYHYGLTIDGKKQKSTYAFKTMPVQGKPARFVVVFGGGSGFTPWFERMWDVMGKQNAIAFMSLGDNVYIDTPDVQATQKYCYYRRQSREEFRRFASGVSISAIWDDHDFSVNDSNDGPDIDKPAWKIPVWKTFRNNWVNPSYGGGEKLPGCWFMQSIADVDFFFMDGRYYRARENGTMLGPKQKQWLLDSLKASKAKFKVLCANVPMSKNVKPGSKDPWDGFPAEREEIFSFLEKNRIEGVFVIAADRHRSDAWKTERPNGYPIYEFQSSKLTNVHTHGIMKGCLFGYNEKCSLGRLVFDTTKDDPEVTYEVINIDNEKKHSLTIKRGELSFKK